MLKKVAWDKVKTHLGSKSRGEHKKMGCNCKDFSVLNVQRLEGEG
jgi:hypothetical protein